MDLAEGQSEAGRYLYGTLYRRRAVQGLQWGQHGARGGGASRAPYSLRREGKDGERLEKAALNRKEEDPQPMRLRVILLAGAFVRRRGTAGIGRRVRMAVWLTACTSRRTVRGW